MPGGTVHYNLKHGQLAAKVATPTWLKIAGSIDMNLSVSQNVEYLAADAIKSYPAWDAPEFSFDASMAEADFAILAVINNGTSSTSGTTPSIIEKFELKGQAGNPPFLWSGLADNINANADRKAFRMTLLNCTASAAVPVMGQTTYGTWPVTGALGVDANGIAVRYEKLESQPTFTAGVYAVA